MSKLQAQEILVRQQSGTYRTNTVAGMNASATMGAQAAADSLGRKLYGERFKTAECVKVVSCALEHWRLFFKPGGLK